MPGTDRGRSRPKSPSCRPRCGRTPVPPATGRWPGPASPRAWSRSGRARGGHFSPEIHSPRAAIRSLWPEDNSGRRNGSGAVYLRSRRCRTSPDFAWRAPVPPRQRPQPRLLPESRRRQQAVLESFRRITARRREGFLVEGREADVDLGAFAFRAFHADLTLVRIDDPLGDCEAEAGAAALAGARLVRPVEAFEDMRKVSTRDPLAGVGHGDVGASVLSDHPHRYLATRRRVG